MKRKDLYMHSTEVEVIRTIGDIQGYLVRMGANQIMTKFSEDKEPMALFFTIAIDGKNIPFQLPARISPIYKILHAGRYLSNHEADLAQAKRVAWRQIYRWVQAQLALIETGMVEAAEVLTPYMQVAPNQSLYQKLAAEQFRNLIPEMTETSEAVTT